MRTSTYIIRVNIINIVAPVFSQRIVNILKYESYISYKCKYSKILRKI